MNENDYDDDGDVGDEDDYANNDIGGGNIGGDCDKSMTMELIIMMMMKKMPFFVMTTIMMMAVEVELMRMLIPGLLSRNYAALTESHIEAHKFPAYPRRTRAQVASLWLHAWCRAVQPLASRKSTAPGAPPAAAISRRTDRPRDSAFPPVAFLKTVARRLATRPASGTLAASSDLDLSLPFLRLSFDLLRFRDCFESCDSHTNRNEAPLRLTFRL